MLAAIQRLYSNPRLTKVFQWSKLVAITGSGQIIVQLSGLVSGIMIIRMLPTNQFAYYTIANTMLSTIMLLADGGITTGTLAFGGKVWDNKQKLGTVLSTAIRLRNRLAIGSIAVGIPIVIYLLLHNGASILMSVLVAASILPAIIAGLSDTLLEIPLKLHQNISALQKNQIFYNLTRLVFIAITLVLFPWVTIILLANGIPRYWANLRLKKLAGDYAEPHQPHDPAIQGQMFNIVKRSLPEIIYYCLSGQLTIWLISIYSNVKSIAEIGAISRISIMINLFAVMFTTLVIPRFAKLKSVRKDLIKNLLIIFLCALLLSLFITAASWLFADQILWLLGKKYSGLKVELVLNIVSTCLAMISGILFQVYSSRGWVMNPLLSISLNIAFLVIGVTITDFNSLKSVIVFNIFVGTLQLLMHLFYALFKMFKSPVIAHD
jgi:hypothetical protein